MNWHEAFFLAIGSGMAGAVVNQIFRSHEHASFIKTMTDAVDNAYGLGFTDGWRKRGEDSRINPQVVIERPQEKPADVQTLPAGPSFAGTSEGRAFPMPARSPGFESDPPPKDTMLVKGGG